MKYGWLFIFILMTGQVAFSQTNNKPKIEGRWRMRTIVVSPAITYDLDHKDALFAQLTKLDNAMKTADSVRTMEMYRQSINELDSTFLELRPDKTFLMGSSAVVKHTFGEDHKGTYEYDAGQSILQLKDVTANLQAVYSATFLNDSTMKLRGSGQSAYLPTTTFRRVQ